MWVTCWPAITPTPPTNTPFLYSGNPPGSADRPSGERLGPICTAATIHFSAAVPNFAWLETRASPAENYMGAGESPLFPVQPRLEGATYPVPEGPGLGVEVDEAAVEAQSFKFWEAPHLKRRDGSVTNW